MVTTGTINGMDASTARTSNIRHLVAEAGGPAEWARRYGGTRWAQAQVSQWISDANPEGIGGRLARDLETAMSLPHGALDRPNADLSQSVGLDVAKLTSLIESLEIAIAKVGHPVAARTKARLLARLYSDDQASAASSAEALQAALASILATLEEA